MSIGKDCVVGSNVIIKKSIIGDRVVIQDNCKIGQKGFGFIPLKGKNLKFPHIGIVNISNDVEIASGCTIDRGSVDDTSIGQNTYLDNQVHIAHNVKIGSDCMIAGQVGFAGSTIVGNNVSIGGQAGISGHLKIGNNVKIGGGSGVIKDIEDNQTVMGYPAVPLRDFLKKKMSTKEIDKKVIESLLPHREPMLLIDKLINIIPLKSATAIMYVKKTGFYVQGHFPNQPVMPGVLIVEAFGQAAAALTAHGIDPKEYENKLVYLMSVDKARFRNPVIPDCELHLEIEAVRSHGRVWKYKGTAKVDGKRMADAEWSATIVDRK